LGSWSQRDNTSATGWIGFVYKDEGGWFGFSTGRMMMGVRYIWETTADPDFFFMKHIEEASIETFCRLQSRNNQLIIKALTFISLSVCE